MVFAVLTAAAGLSWATTAYGASSIVGLVQPEAPAGVASHIDTTERSSLFVVGRISADPRKTQPRLETMANYIAGHLRENGYRSGAGIVAASEADMIRYIREGKVDMISESALSALRIAEVSGAEIVLREWKDKMAVYRGVIFVAKDSPIYTLEDLRGRRLALEDRGSTTGFLMPLAALRNAGLPIVELESPSDEVPADAVGYVLAGSELNISTWTARGIVDGGGYSDLDFEDGSQTPNRVRDDLRLLYLSPPVIRSLVLIRPGMPPDVRRRVLDVLLAIDSEDDARDVRRSYYGVERYDPIDSAGQKSLNDVRRAAEALGPLLH